VAVAPPPHMKIKDSGGNPPSLVILDGEPADINVNDIDPSTVESVNVIKGQPAIDKYGEKAKEGVVEIVTKKTREPAYIAVEELPEFPGGYGAFKDYVSKNVRHPEGVSKDKVKGKVEVTFVVTRDGKISQVKVTEPLHPAIDAEAVRVIGSMPDWIPGKQNGKPVDVQMRVPVEF